MTFKIPSLASPPTSVRRLTRDSHIPSQESSSQSPPDNAPHPTNLFKYSKIIFEGINILSYLGIKESIKFACTNTTAYNIVRNTQDNFAVPIINGELKSCTFITKIFHNLKNKLNQPKAMSSNVQASVNELKAFIRNYTTLNVRINPTLHKRLFEKLLPSLDEILKQSFKQNDETKNNIKKMLEELHTLTKVKTIELNNISLFERIAQFELTENNIQNINFVNNTWPANRNLILLFGSVILVCLIPIESKRLLGKEYDFLRFYQMYIGIGILSLASIYWLTSCAVNSRKQNKNRLALNEFKNTPSNEVLTNKSTISFLRNLSRCYPVLFPERYKFLEADEEFTSGLIFLKKYASLFYFEGVENRGSEVKEDPSALSKL